MRKFIFALMALIVGVGAVDVATFDRAAWKSDHARIKQGMARHYANLDWVRDERGLDLAALDRRTAERIDGSWSHIQAYSALEDFVAAFADPHLKLALGRAALPSVTTSHVGARADPPAGKDCAGSGYGNDDHSFAPHFSALPGGRPIGEGSFPTAVAGAAGFIRIASFSEQEYAAACVRAFRTGIGDRALQLAVRAELQKELAKAIAGLEAAGARTLVVDLSGNGGGSEWDREAATLFTARPMRRAEARIADAPCNRMAVWSGAQAPCAVFRATAETAALKGAGKWNGPLWILTDSSTASAAEEFLGWLKDNKAARQLGERTMGAGCGYVNGGAPVTLASVPMTVRMPNCARYTAAGRNEIEGWSPDRPLPSPDKGEESAWALHLMSAVGG